MAKIYDKETKYQKEEAKEVSLWQDRINTGKKEQDLWAEESGAKRFIQEYKGNYGIVFNTRTKKVPIPPINDVFAFVQSDIASTYNRDPYITVNAKAGTTKGAAFWEVILNYYWRVLKNKEELEYEIIDKDLVGHAWHKVGYTANSVGVGDSLQIEDESIYSSHVYWKDIVFNVGSKRPPVDSQWIAQRLVLPLSEIKKRYKAARNLEGTASPDVQEDTYKKSPYKDDIKVGIIWEIWDAQKKEVLLIAEGLKDKFLQPKKPWPDYLKEFPFLMYWDFAVPESAYPMSAIAPWEPQILEEMILMGSAVNHAKRWNRQTFVKNGTIDDNSLDKYERGDDGAIITYNGDSADIKFADFGQLPTDFYLLMDRLQATKRSLNFQPEFRRGGTTKTQSRTVGELNLIEAGSRGMEERKMDRLETHLENIARHLMFNLQGNFDMESSVKITGQEPEQVIEALGKNFDPITGMVTFTPEDIKGEYDVDIKAGSTIPMNKQNRIQVMETILQTVAQATANGPMSPFLNALIQELLKDYEVKGLQEAYMMEVAQFQKQQQEQAGQQSIEDQKVGAEAAKRMAQAKQITVDTAIQEQEAQLGAIGRARVEKYVKTQPKKPGEKR